MVLIGQKQPLANDCFWPTSASCCLLAKGCNRMWIQPLAAIAKSLNPGVAAIFSAKRSLDKRFQRLFFEYFDREMPEALW